MVKAQTSGLTTTAIYTYNGDGLRIAQAVNGTETRFTWDQALALPELLATSDGTRYLHGLGLEGVQKDDSWSYPLADLLGSVRQWSDAAGGVFATADYDPYGNLLSRTGNRPAPIGFAGEWEDAATGLQYLRARWYSPAQGRFTQIDPFPGVPTNPLTQNPYVYALNNPTRFVDPSGMSAADIARGVGGTLLLGAAAGAVGLAAIGIAAAAPGLLGLALAGGLLGMAAGALGYTEYTAITKQCFSYRDLGISAVLGAFIGVMFLLGSSGLIAANVAGLISIAAQLVLDDGRVNMPNIVGAYFNGFMSTALFLIGGGASAVGLAALLKGGISGVFGDFFGKYTTSVLNGFDPRRIFNDLYSPKAFWSYAQSFGWAGALSFGGSRASQTIKALTRWATNRFVIIPSTQAALQSCDAILIRNRFIAEGMNPTHPGIRTVNRLAGEYASAAQKKWALLNVFAEIGKDVEVGVGYLLNSSIPPALIHNFSGSAN